jgi:hypothetical protein
MQAKALYQNGFLRIDVPHAVSPAKDLLASASELK